MTTHYNYANRRCCEHVYFHTCVGVMQSVALIDIYYVNKMQMQHRMLKVIHYQYAFALYK